MGTKLNKKAFSTVEVLIVILVILVLGLGGWYVYKHNHKKATKVTSTTTSSNMNNMNMSTSTYAGWKTYTSPNEKSSFMYPSNWKFTTVNYPSVPSAYPAYDDTTITSPNGTIVEYISSLPGNPGGCADSPLNYHISELNKLKNVSYLNIAEFSNKNNGSIVGMSLIMNTDDSGDSCRIYSNIQDVNLFYPEPGGGGPSTGEFEAYVGSDYSLKPINTNDIKDLENIFQSYTY